MKESRLRFTTQEKLAILGKISLIGLESTLRKHHLTVKVLIRWQKQFKGSKAGHSIHPIKGLLAKAKADSPKPEKPAISEKEDARDRSAMGFFPK
jgi:hypothetical protein